MTEREREQSVEPGSAAPDIALVNAEGEVVRLSSFWALRPTALVFVRHFG